jgi:hypothetical protein
MMIQTISPEQHLPLVLLTSVNVLLTMSPRFGHELLKERLNFIMMVGMD